MQMRMTVTKKIGSFTNWMDWSENDKITYANRQQCREHKLQLWSPTISPKFRWWVHQFLGRYCKKNWWLNTACKNERIWFFLLENVFDRHGEKKIETQTYRTNFGWKFHFCEWKLHFCGNWNTQRGWNQFKYFRRNTLFNGGRIQRETLDSVCDVLDSPKRSTQFVNLYTMHQSIDNSHRITQGKLSRATALIWIFDAVTETVRNAWIVWTIVCKWQMQTFLAELLLQ